MKQPARDDVSEADGRRHGGDRARGRFGHRATLMALGRRAKGQSQALRMPNDSVDRWMRRLPRSRATT